MDFILASESPRRIDMLKRMGLAFDVIPANVDEDYINGESPKEHIFRLAEGKAGKVAKSHPDKWILAADTVVVLDFNILGKPADKAEASRMLKLLSGREHKVYTGYCLMHATRRISEIDFAVSKVKIKRLSKSELEFYVNTDEPYDKAGGYAVQGIGAFMVDKIDGSYTNVVGLPLSRLINKMQSLGIIKL